MKEKIYDYRYLYKQFCKFLSKNRMTFLAKVKKKTMKREELVFWITPWFSSPTPWYSIVMAMIYHLYTGDSVTFVINDLLYDSKIFPAYKDLRPLIEKTIMRLRPFHYIRIMKLSKFPAKGLDKNELHILEDAAALSTIKMLQTSKDGSKYDKMYLNWKEELLPVAERINSLIPFVHGKCMVFPGATFAETEYLLKKCKLAQINTITYDAAVGRLLLGYNCVAGQYGNTKEVYEVVKKSAGKIQFLEDVGDVLHNRMNAKEEIGIVSKGSVIQTKACGDDTVTQYDAVIFSNIEHDSAALGTHIFYKNDREWLLNTVEYILKNTNYKVAVREHPAQRQFNNRNALKYLQEQYGENPRFHLYRCVDKVNSYDLLKKSKVVLVNTSSVGVESAMLGKCVVTESNSYYSQSDFVKKCQTEKEYFETIQSVLDNPQELPMSARESAGLYYGLIQLCGGASTKFTAHNVDYFEWTKMSVKELIDSDDTKLVFKSLVRREEQALVKYKDLYR